MLSFFLPVITANTHVVIAAAVIFHEKKLREYGFLDSHYIRFPVLYHQYGSRTTELPGIRPVIGRPLADIVRHHRKFRQLSRFRGAEHHRQDECRNQKEFESHNRIFNPRI